MSFCQDFGKDKVIFVTQEDHEKPPTESFVFEEVEEEPRGLILPNGEINWGCPCLGGMATGPCGPHFREAFSCFHYSTADPKGSDCYEKFSVMQQCLSEHPTLYPVDKDDDDEEKAEDLKTSVQDMANVSSEMEKLSVEGSGRSSTREVEKQDSRS